ncbi:protein kinase [Nonomuraea sp. NPDC059007]|uniref:serine/threonine-protein kinase n=1 Tax=Nonomuraea sp. NPDC059007 TaxID=3346692 RepID=UPI00368A02FE
MSGGRLANRYALIRPLGSGGMGRVWLARDEMLDREVAVKELTLPEHLAPRERHEAVTRAVREAQATAQLRHPGIVALHDVIVEHDRPWLVMELLRGRDLGALVAAQGPLPPAQVARIGAETLDALSAAHARGLQHRDVKPGNVFLTDSGRVVLTDFGIARQEGQATLTEQGLMIGSPGFIAPERLEGHPGGPASDLWSLAATLFLAAEGSPVYDGPVAERIKNTLTRPPRPARGPIGLLLAAMLARDPAARPDAATALHALRQLAAGQNPELPRGHDATVPTRRKGRGRAWIWIAAAAAVLLVAGVGGFFLLRPGDNAPPSAYNVPLDLCKLLTPEEVGTLLDTRQAPAVKPSADEVGPKCGWTLQGAGLGLQVQKDSDTPDPWRMTPATAGRLLTNQERYWNRSAKLQWTWPEIGVKQSLPASRGAIRKVAAPGEGGFAFELSGKTGRVHSSFVLFRTANLVVQVEYTTINNKPTDVEIRNTAQKAAQLIEQGLRRAG